MTSIATPTLSVPLPTRDDTALSATPGLLRELPRPTPDLFDRLEELHRQKFDAENVPEQWEGD